LKEWLDLVLQHGFAYGHRGTALHGKKLLSAITTGGSKQAYCREGYNYFSLQELLVPFEQTARLCGMEYLPPFVVHETHQLREQHQIAKHADDYRTAIISLRDNTINWELLKQFKQLNQNLAEVIKIQETPHHA
jgi:glutathione-regulated potassium-efflux system ancillary protein KefG